MYPPPPTQSKGLRPWEGMEDRHLSRFLSFDTCAYVCVLYVIACILTYDYMLNPNRWATYWVLYIILKPHATHIFQVRARPPCTANGGYCEGHGSLKEGS